MPSDNDDKVVPATNWPVVDCWALQLLNIKAYLQSRVTRRVISFGPIKSHPKIAKEELTKNGPKMSPQALKSRPNGNQSPNLVTLLPSLLKELEVNC